MLTFADISSSFKSAKTEEELPGIGRVWKYLSDRGINRDLANSIGLFIIREGDLLAAMYGWKTPKASTRAAIVIPHYGFSGEKIDWWAARFVSLSPEGFKPKLVSSFADLLEVTQSKVTCPPKEPVHAYLAPGKVWTSIQQGEKVYIHESAIKALNGSILGKYSIGLNGVWGWSSRKFDIPLIGEIRDLQWKAKKLQPVIVFDSNVTTNPQVQRAESFLAAKIYEFTGQTAIALRLPPPPDGAEKGWGFDDYRAHVGDRKAREFLEGEGTPVDISEKELLISKLNSEVCLVRNIGKIVELETGTLMSRAQFTDMNYAHYMAEVDDDGRRVNVPKIWLSDSRRREVEKIDYMPGQPRVFDNRYNMWHGMGCEPVEGDIEPWLDLLYINVPDEDIRNWIISWLAYPLQNLGEKMNSLLLMVGRQGTGKNLFLAPIKEIYGKNAVTVSSDNLRSSFNSIYANKQFIHADELKKVRDEDEQVNQRIKMLVTDDKMVVNTKGEKEYTHVNCANLVLTSNHTDCVKLDQDDRRACVVRFENSIRIKDQVYWRKYVEWFEGEGPAALYRFLLEWDVVKYGFDPAAWAPLTEEKEYVTEAGMNPLESTVGRLWKNPDHVLPLLSEGRALWTAKELVPICIGDGKEIDERKKQLVANALRNQGFRQATKAPLRIGAEQSRYWVIRRRDEDWSESAKCLNHLKPFYKLK